MALSKPFAKVIDKAFRTVYELPLTYWRVTHQILGEERELRPAWASTLDALRDSPAKLQRKDLELALSDAVVVPSRFVAESLAVGTGATEADRDLSVWSRPTGRRARGRTW